MRLRTALLSFAFSLAGLLWLGWGQAASNADFLYMCAAAARLDQGQLTATPYFPPGYPLLIWAAVRAGLLLWPGMTALYAGTLLSALGGALSAGALSFGARLYRLPPMPALLLGLLGLSLPDTAQIAFNPHLDALYTGLGLSLLAAVLSLLQRPQSAGLRLCAALCGALLLTLRWHAVLLVLPGLLILLLRRDGRLRAAGLGLLCAGLLAAGLSYYTLWRCTGGLESAAARQIATGAVYRQAEAAGTDDAVQRLYTDYAGWLASAPPLTHALVLEGLRANWPVFVTRKAVLGGAGLFLLMLALYRRWPPGAQWLLVFIAGYSAAVAPTYFTPRASALVELSALLLGASGLGLASEPPRKTGSKSRAALPAPRFDPALLCGLLALLFLVAAAYNAWRVERDFRQVWEAGLREQQAVWRRALAQTGGEAGALWGYFFQPPQAQMPWCLSGPTYSRLWMDDPQVAPLVGALLPKLTPEALLGEGSAPGAVKAVLLWPGYCRIRDRELAARFDAQPERWQPVESGSPNARIWVRRE